MVSVPQRTAYDAHLSQAKPELYIYTHVREEAFDLYGFSTVFEKELFLILLTVNGVGPKSALGVLSSVEPGELIEAIVQADQAFLTQIPGIGKKTAERVVLELKDTIRKKISLGWGQKILEGASDASGFRVKDGLVGSDFDQAGSPIFEDAKSALVGLGYRDQDIQQLLSRVIKSLEHPPRTVEDLVRTALRQLA
jgi:Holliday junction DNA helicase RuvA